MEKYKTSLFGRICSLLVGGAQLENRSSSSRRFLSHAVVLALCFGAALPMVAVAQVDGSAFTWVNSIIYSVGGGTLNLNGAISATRGIGAGAGSCWASNRTSTTVYTSALSGRGGGLVGGNDEGGNGGSGILIIRYIR